MVWTEELCDCRKCEPQTILWNSKSASEAGFQSPSPAAADFIRGRCDEGADTVKVDFKTEYEVKDSKWGLVAERILLYSICNTIKIPKGFCDIISDADHISATCLNVCGCITECYDTHKRWYVSTTVFCCINIR